MSPLDSNAEECWRPIYDCPGYEVSNHGRVRSFRRKGIGKISVAKVNKVTGYCQVGLITPSGSVTTRTVHRLVAAAFVGPIGEGVVVNHIDGSRTNNHASNLEIVGRAANVLHGNFREWVKSVFREELRAFLDEVRLMLQDREK